MINPLPIFGLIPIFDRIMGTVATGAVVVAAGYQFANSINAFSIGTLAVAFISLGLNAWGRWNDNTIASMRSQVEANKRLLDQERHIRVTLESQVLALQSSQDSTHLTCQKLELEIVQMSRMLLERSGIITPDISSESHPILTAIAGRDVLVVEDDDASRNAMAKLLMFHKLTITTARDVQEAIELITVRDNSGRRFDFILLDMSLPGGTGVDVMKFLRSRNIPTQVIVTSAAQDGPLIENARVYNPLAFLRKPTDLYELLGLLGADRRKMIPESVL